MGILIVDDSNLARIAISNILLMDGFSAVHIVGSGSEALAYLDRHGASVDAILMDVMMPEMNGLETLRAIRARKAFEEVPVLMVSAGDDDELIKAAFDAGALDFVPKPIRRLELCARVRSSLRLKSEMDRRRARERELEELNGWLHRHNLELARSARTDALTGLANRFAIDDTLDREWQRAARAGTWLAAAIIDLDHFKAYNDRYGHPAGDQCLIAVARLMQQQLRRAGDFVGRYGGEEFLVLLPDTELGGALEVAESIRRAIEDARLPHEVSPTAPHVTASVGLAAVVPRPSLGPGPLVAHADSALYAAKHAGRNTVVTRAVGTLAPPPPGFEPSSRGAACSAVPVPPESRCAGPQHGPSTAAERAPPT